MRDAKVSDIWRNLEKRVFPSRIERLSIKGLIGFSDCDVIFDRGLTILAGVNGAGKSSILDALSQGITGQAAVSPWVAKSRLENSILEVDCAVKQTSVRFNYPRATTDENPPTIPVTRFDSGTFARRLRDSVYSTENFSDLLDGVSAKTISAGVTLDLINYIIGKSYTGLEIFEYEGFDGSEEPYFRCTCAEGNYGAESMGLGELSLLCLYWLVERQNTDSFIVVEEPETHVAFRSQARLFNYLARRSLEKGLWLVVSTHSSAVIGSVPLSYLRIVQRVGGQTQVLTSPNENQVLATLELTPKVKAALLLEDLGAKSLLQAVIRRHCPNLARSFELVVLNGEGEIQNSLRSYPHKIQSFKIRGVFDGGFTVPDDLTDLATKIPGDVPPDKVLQSIVSSIPQTIATTLGFTSQQMSDARAAADSHEHHQWVNEMIKALGISLDEIYSASYRSLPDSHPLVVEGDGIATILSTYCR